MLSFLRAEAHENQKNRTTIFVSWSMFEAAISAA